MIPCESVGSRRTDGDLLSADREGALGGSGLWRSRGGNTGPGSSLLVDGLGIRVLALEVAHGGPRCTVRVNAAPTPGGPAGGSLPVTALGGAAAGAGVDDAAATCSSSSSVM